MKLEYKKELEEIMPLLLSEDEESILLSVSLFKQCKFYTELISLKDFELFIDDDPHEETNFKSFITYCFENKHYGGGELGEWIRDLLKGTSRITAKQIVKTILVDFSLINGN